MAKTVGDLLIKLGVDGIEGVNVLKSSLTALGKAAGPTDKSIRKIRTEILEFANAGQKSTQAIRGVIESFKGLQAQASIGSGVFKQLAADIEGLEDVLESIKPDAEKAAEAMDRLQKIGFPSKVPDAFEKNMKVRRQELRGLAVDSEAYLDKLVGIRNFEAQQAARLARQDVAAAARVAATGLPKIIVQSDQPATLAALRLRIGEVQTEIENLDFTTDEYANANKKLIDLQQELKDVLDGTSDSFRKLEREKARVARRAEKLAGIDAATGGAGINPRTGTPMVARDPNTGVMIAGGSVSPIPTAVPELSALYKTITQIETAGVDATLDRMGKSYQQVTKDIRSATAASNGSINSLQAQRNAFAQLRAGLDPTSQDFRELGKEIEKVDRRLEKLNKRRRRPTIGGIAQGLGGIAAGGVFGGPEGALGAAVGGAVGGVAGVAAGAAIGAQVKMVREALGATSDYAAQLQKLEIALEGVTEVTDKFGNVDKASSLGNYQLGLKAAADVTRDFNIPLDVSTKGITRLAAAVIGAGGNIGDAEVVFRNITSAIKATGGGAQDVDSAITAMVQTFSKGKVSAEELSGQLGERLPGAVTKFAEANNMTLPELQKAFKAGTVGLDQLMKFIISLGPEYEETARKIADSSADAGAKAAVAFDQVRREVGEALQPIGAQLQKAFAKFVLDILPAIKGLAVGAAAGLNALLDVSSFLIANFKELLIVAGAAGIALALQNLIGIATALGTAFGKATVAMKGFTAASLLNPWVALAAGITAATVAIVKYSKRNAEFNKSVIAGKTSNEEANDRLREMNDKVKELQDRLETEGNGRMIRQLKNQLKAAKIAADDLSLAMKLASSYEVAGIKYDRMTGRPIDAPSSHTPHDYDDPDADPSGSGSGTAPMSEVELNLRRQMRETIENEQKIKQSLVQLELDLLAAAAEVEDKLKRTNMQEQARFEHRQRVKDIIEAEKDMLESIKKPVEDLLNSYSKEIKTRKRVNELVEQGVDEGLAREYVKIEEIIGAQRKLLDERIKYLRVQLAGLKAESEAAQAIRDQIRAYEEARGQLPSQEAGAKNDAAELNKKPTFMEGLGELIEQQQKALIELLNPLNQVKDAANAMGEAFKTSFKGIINGSMTGRQALASFFKSVGDHFVDMAARIAAEAIKLAALKFVEFIISAMSGVPTSGGGGGGGAYAIPGAAVPKTSGIKFFAKGGVLAKNKIVPYAKGGIVNKPTLFQYASGGAGRFGLMGESGAEAIMPLRRGSNGKLGVQASGAGIGNITVNVDASGSSVEGDQDRAGELGRMLGAAVQAELIKQKRPGGLLA